MLRLAGVACTTALVLSLPSVASAATVRFTNSTIEYRGVLEQNNLRIYRDAGEGVVLEELPIPGTGTQAEIVPEQPCVSVTTHRARCPYPTLLDVNIGGSTVDPEAVVNDTFLTMVAIGGPGPDRLVGGDGFGDERLEGGDGDDRLEGRAGYDRLLGGPGSDRLLGGKQPDALVGGPGFDWADYSEHTDNLAVRMDTGDQPSSERAGESSDAIDGSVEGLVGGSGHDFIHGSDRDDVIHGGPGKDVVYGHDGTDILYGDEGDDVLESTRGPDTESLMGGPGDDVLESGTAPDRMIGGEGVDLAGYRAFFSAISVTLGDGVANDGPEDGPSDYINVEGDYSIEGVKGGWGGSAKLVGDEFDNVLVGSWGPNEIDGRGGNDVVAGWSRNDVLTGGPGEDKFSGWEGDDVFYARDGEPDRIDCRAGNDVVFGDPSDIFRDDANLIDKTCEAGGTEVSFDVQIPKKTEVPRTGVMRYVIPCAPPAVPTCSGSVRLDALGPKASRRKIGKQSFSIPVGSKRTVKVKLTAAGRALVRRRGSARARVTVTGRDGYAAAKTLVGSTILKSDG